jgi:hypothetical protein
MTAIIEKIKPSDEEDDEKHYRGITSTIKESIVSNYLKFLLFG